MNALLVINRAAVVFCLVIAIGRSEFAAAAEAAPPTVNEALYERALGLKSPQANTGKQVKRHNSKPNG